MTSYAGKMDDSGMVSIWDDLMAEKTFVMPGVSMGKGGIQIKKGC